MAVLFIIALFNTAQAQGERQVINFSGIVVHGDSAYGLPHVNLYNISAHTGTITNAVGFFNMNVLSGDTVYISSIGYKRQRYIIPRRNEAAFTVMIELKADTTMLPVVEILPFANPEVFKQAFLALQLPEQKQYQNMEKNLDNQQITNMSMAMPMDASLNYRYYSQQQVNVLANRNSAPSLSLLNPFAWADLIRSIKRGDFKKKN